MIRPRASLLEMARHGSLRASDADREHVVDRRGYPFGLAADAIPLAPRIVAIADVFDALAFERKYKRAWPLEAAVAEIDVQRGHQFDPQLVDAFMLLDHHELVAPVHPERSAARRRDLTAATAGADSHVSEHTRGSPLRAVAAR